MSDKVKKIIIIIAVMLVAVFVAFGVGRNVYYTLENAHWQNARIPTQALTETFSKISDAPESFESKTAKGTYANGDFSAEYEITVSAGRKFYCANSAFGSQIKTDNGAWLFNAEWYTDSEMFDYDGTYKLDMFYQHKEFIEPEGNFTVEIKATCKYPYAEYQQGFFNEIATQINSTIETLK